MTIKNKLIPMAM